jgi:aldehyde:ferredoxin oxidoreductase
MSNGYHGKILHVDLTKGLLEVEEPDETFYRRYMGGSAWGAYYLLKHTPAGADPLGPENTLVFSLSVVTGAPVSGQSRMVATAKSPLTGGIGDGQCGGFWPAECKFAGFDAIVVKGKAEKPVYLWVHDGEAELRDASHLWGKITGEVEAQIKQELGDSKIEVAQCGPGGENLVRFAAIINMSNRANGRTGLGAVMGSKNLKAVAVRGKMRPPLADKEALSEIARWGAKNFEDSNVYGLGLLGTAGIISGQQAMGGFPTRNWDSGVFEGWETLDGQAMADTILTKRDTCYSCVVRCKREVEQKEGPYPLDPHYGGPEYESISTLGSYCGVDDLVAVSFANQLCNQYGLDTISCGATIAWAMNCFEEGLITTADTGGIELNYGNADALVKLTEMIGQREGFGDLLAEGSARAAAKIGRGTEDLVVAVKKQELPAHMPQVKRSLALIYAVNPFGADHQSHEHDPSYAAFSERLAALDLIDPQPSRVLNGEKVRFALYTQYFYSCLDTLSLCQFVWGPSFHLYGPNQMVDMVRAVTGWDVSLWELMKVGERRLNLLRAFNAREGIDRQADKLPKKMFKALTGGPSDGVAVGQEEVDRAKDLYYEMAGWDVTTGTPTRAKLEELGLTWVAEEIGL